MNDNHRVDASWRFIACPNRKLTQLAVKHIPSVRFLLVNPIPRFACVRKHPPATRQLFFRLCCETKLQEIVDTHTHTCCFLFQQRTIFSQASFGEIVDRLTFSRVSAGLDHGNERFPVVWKSVLASNRVVVTVGDSSDRARQSEIKNEERKRGSEIRFQLNGVICCYHSCLSIVTRFFGSAPLSIFLSCFSFSLRLSPVCVASLSCIRWTNNRIPSPTHRLGINHTSRAESALLSRRFAEDFVCENFSRNEDENKTSLSFFLSFFRSFVAILAI